MTSAACHLAVDRDSDLWVIFLYQNFARSISHYVSTQSTSKTRPIALLNFGSSVLFPREYNAENGYIQVFFRKVLVIHSIASNILFESSLS